MVFNHRVVVSPMATYRADRSGASTDWHFVHNGAAMGGAAMAMVESTAVSTPGRIGYACLGLWNDQQATALGGIAAL